VKKIFLLGFSALILLLNISPVQAETQLYTFLGPDSYGNYSCIPDKNGTLTYDECQAKLQAGRYTLNPGNLSAGSAPFCQKDPNGQYATYDECQAKLTEGRYSINPGNPSVAIIPFCQKDPNGQYATLADCQASLHANKKYEIFVPSVGYGNPTCVESTKGTYTWDECLNAVHNLVPPSTPTPPPPPCKQVDKVWICPTAFGDINTNPAGFVKSIFGILLSLAGGVALVLIIISGYRLMTSQGNPEKVQQAREQLTSAIVGLLFIIFSVTILQIIGVDILHIPGLNP